MATTKVPHFYCTASRRHSVYTFIRLGTKDIKQKITSLLQRDKVENSFFFCSDVRYIVQARLYGNTMTNFGCSPESRGWLFKGTAALKTPDLVPTRNWWTVFFCSFYTYLMESLIYRDKDAYWRILLACNDSITTDPSNFLLTL